MSRVISLMVGGFCFPQVTEYLGIRKCSSSELRRFLI